MEAQLAQAIISDAMPIVAAFLSAWLTRGRRSTRPPRRRRRSRPVRDLGDAQLNAVLGEGGEHAGRHPNPDGGNAEPEVAGENGFRAGAAARDLGRTDPDAVSAAAVGPVGEVVEDGCGEPAPGVIAGDGPRSDFGDPPRKYDTSSSARRNVSSSPSPPRTLDKTDGRA